METGWLHYTEIQLKVISFFNLLCQGLEKCVDLNYVAWYFANHY